MWDPDLCVHQSNRVFLLDPDLCVHQSNRVFLLDSDLCVHQSNRVFFFIVRSSGIVDSWLYCQYVTRSIDPYQCLEPVGIGILMRRIFA